MPIAVSLFALSGPLIRYSAEAKQYSTDVALALVLLLATLRIWSASKTGAVHTSTTVGLGVLGVGAVAVLVAAWMVGQG